MSVQQLQTQTLYKIIETKEIDTQYGTTYILIDDNLDEYWSNKKIATFIKQNKIPSSKDGKVLFKIKTGDYKTFEKDGNEIRFLNVICSK